MIDPMRRLYEIRRKIEILEIGKHTFKKQLAVECLEIERQGILRTIGAELRLVSAIRG